MNILVLGSGGREHTFAYQLAKSERCKNIFVAPGNAGTAAIATNVALSVTDFSAIEKCVVENHINMVIVGPEDPLVQGITDYFAETPSLKKVQIIGPSKRGALLEGSKERAKEFMMAHNIPTAAYASFTKASLEAGKQFLETLSPPYVLKADGLAAGKGVLIIEDISEAKMELEAMLSGKFGDAST
ncbi:MAG: phosphoribosylamine--glycine ligase, partial [Candidatus Azotimanducaceae bacterium]